MTSVEEIIKFPVRPAPEAVLSIYEHPKDVPFEIARVFVINAKEATQRGAHAHKNCQQLLVCIQGRIVVSIDDGQNKRITELSSPDAGLLVPPGLWAEQDYDAGSLLMVLTDQPYDEADYIRDYNDFKEYKGL